MKKFISRMLDLDRRIIFLLITLAILVPIIRPLNLPGVQVTPSVRRVYDTMESIPEGSPILVSFDFDLASKPELYPQAVAICRHAFKRNLRVVGMNLWAPASGIAEEVLSTTAREYHKEYGKDYVYLGYQIGAFAVITQMGSDIYGIYPKDSKMNDTREMPVMSGIKSLRDFAFMMDFSAGNNGIEEWIAFGSDKFGFKIGCGSTAVNETTLRPYIQTGQMVGLLGAMKGGAEYETLLGIPGKATAGMEAVGMGQMLILVLILMANIGIILNRFYR